MTHVIQVGYEQRSSLQLLRTASIGVEAHLQRLVLDIMEEDSYTTPFGVWMNYWRYAVY
jgi:hypothetical protein